MATEMNAQARGTNGNEPLEKDFSNNPSGYQNGRRYDLHDNMESGDALRRIQTSGSISISPELFEKIYLSPQNAVKGDLRKTFGNPTPLALVGFLLCLSPLSCDLMGWRGAGGNGAAGIGSYFFFGGVLMLVSGFLEFIIGNTFPFVVFMSFGSFWLTFAATLQPFYNAYGAYAPAGATSIAEGLATQGFNSSFAFFLVFMGVLCFIYFVCSLRTNVVFVVIFTTLVIAFGLLGGVYFHVSKGNVTIAHRLTVAGGAVLFVTCMAGWWILSAIMLAALDFPFQIPVGDLSTLIKGYSEKKVTKEMV